MFSGPDAAMKFTEYLEGEAHRINKLMHMNENVDGIIMFRDENKSYEEATECYLC